MRRAALRIALAVVLVLTGLSAMWGGSMLMQGTWEMDPAWLERTPFTSWTLPGLATLIFPGIGVLIAGVWVAFRLPHHRAMASVAGIGLMVWVGVELAWLQVLHPVMHPLIFAIGLLALTVSMFLPRPQDRRHETASRTGPVGGGVFR